MRASRRTPWALRMSHVRNRHLYPPTGTGAGGQSADPADRSEGDDRPADPPIPQAVEYDDYGHDDLSRRLARFDAGLHHDADLASGVDGRGHRLFDRVVDSRDEHRHCLYPAQLRSEPEIGRAHV